MGRAKLVGFLAIGGVVALIVVLSVTNRQPPRMPADRAHAAWEGHQACLSCHGPAGTHPQEPDHPIGNDCTRCHAIADR